MFNSVQKFNQENSEKKRILNFDIILDEMTEEVKRDLELRYECDMFLLDIDNKTEGDILFNLVMIKSIFCSKKYTEDWFEGRIAEKIISIIIFLHLPYSDYIRNYTRNLFRFLLVNLDTFNLIIVRNAIEESYEKNPFINDIGIDSEKIIEFSAFLSQIFSENDKRFEEYEINNPFFKSKYTKKIENIEGSLIGKAVGNSIGFFVDGQNSDLCCEYIDIVIKKILHLYGIDKDLGKSDRPRYCLIEGNEKTILFAYGQYTEDTQSTREMLMSIEDGKLNIETFKKKLISLYGQAGIISWDNRINCVKSGIVGNAEISAIQNMASGISWQDSGKGERIGACIRSAPLGAVYMGRKDLCKSVSDLQCVGTNNCTTARACAVLIAETTRLGIENKIKPYARYNLLTNSSIFCRQLVLSIMSIEPNLEKYILTIPDLIARRNMLIRESKFDYTNACIFADKQIIKIITSECAKTFGEKLSHGGETISSSPVQITIFCIYCFLCIPDFYISAICMSIRAGGDTDTTAAIVGGILGARLGIESIPSYFVQKINDQGNYKSDELIQLSEKLYCQNFTNLDKKITDQLFTSGTIQPSTSNTFGTIQPSNTFGTLQTFTPVTIQTSIQPSTFGTTQATLGTNQSYTFVTPQATSETTKPNIFGTPQATSETTKPNIFGTPQATSETTKPNIFGTPQATSVTTKPNIFGTTQATSGTNQPYKFGTPQATSVNTKPNIFGTPQATSGNTKPNIFGTPQATSGTNQPYTFVTPQTTLSASMFEKPPIFGNNK
jgi:ADP-ribosylglycohydrolase